jgi:hypothetical protein
MARHHASRSGDRLADVTDDLVRDMDANGLLLPPEGEPASDHAPREEAAVTPAADAAHLHTPPEIASDQDILATFASALRVCGVVGEERNAKVVYLALTSRLLDEPVSLALKGVSSSGKSHTTETTLKFFPASAYIGMTAMSEHALVYMKDDFTHRTLVLFEAVALREQREKAESNLTAYFVRSLLSEGRISYPVTQKDKDGNFVTKTIVKNGPTNLIVTTTATSLHGENETRLISLPTNDTNGQTRAIMLRLAAGKPKSIDFSGWHRLQEWLEGAERRVVIPYARYLAENVPPVAVRLRRDFRSILRLIETHAILHQLSRDRDEDGRIIASEADYLAVRALVADLISDGVGATVSGTLRETVECVSALTPATVYDVAKTLKLDRSAAQRRLQSARERGYIVNKEDKRGRPARYEIDTSLPDELVLLPEGVHARPNPPRTASTDKPAGQEGVCSSAATAEGNPEPPKVSSSPALDDPQPLVPSESEEHPRERTLTPQDAVPLTEYEDLLQQSEKVRSWNNRVLRPVTP